MEFVGISEIDLSSWELFEDSDPFGGLRTIVEKGFLAQTTDMLRKEFRENPPRIELAFGWSDIPDPKEKPVDPATLDILLPLGKDGDENPTYRISLEAAVDFVLMIQSEGGHGEIVSDREGQDTCRAIAKRLRELADKLDAACKGAGEEAAE
jgi:hypothetical protein